jgi:hypothetical protein
MCWVVVASGCRNSCVSCFAACQATQAVQLDIDLQRTPVVAVGTNSVCCVLLLGGGDAGCAGGCRILYIART